MHQIIYTFISEKIKGAKTNPRNDYDTSMYV